MILLNGEQREQGHMYSPPSRAELYAPQYGFPLACLDHSGYPQLVSATVNADRQTQTQLIVAGESIQSKIAVHEHPEPTFARVVSSDVIILILQCGFCE